MKKLLAGVVAAVGVMSAAGSLGAGVAAADPDDEGGTSYNLGGAKVPGIPYDEYTRRAGNDYFPDMKRQLVDYPSGQMQGRLLANVLPGMGLDSDSVGESIPVGADNLNAAIQGGRGQRAAIGLSEGALVLDAEEERLANDPTAPPPDQLSFGMFGDPVARHAFGQSFLTSMFAPGTLVPLIDYRIPPPVESQYDTKQVVAAYDMVADFPDRPDNLMALINTFMGLAVGHTAVAFTDPAKVPPQNIRTTVNSRGGRTTTYLVAEKHLPLVLPFGYVGVPENVLNELDEALEPMVDSGYSRNDDPVTRPLEVDPVNGFDPATATAAATKATFGGADPLQQILDMFKLGKR